MSNSEQDFTPQESLKVIRSMIETSRHSFSDDSSYYLLWGWAVMLACIGYYALLVSGYSNPAIAFGLIPVALVVYLVMIRRRTKREEVKTFVGDATGYLWTALGFCFFAFSFIFSKIGWQYCFPFYIMLYGVGTYVSGKLIQFKPMAIGGAACLILAIITPYLPFDKQILMAAFALLISYIIPGHMLRAHYKKQKTA